MEYKYWAFLSYSHQDNLHERADGTTGHIRWAELLHESLETWKVPKEFRSRQTRTGEPMPERFFPVFQDEKELPLNSNLASSIRTALEESRFLIVICSPRSAGSFYVNEEVLYFKQLGRLDNILALIVDGEPNASMGTKTGIALDQECFCPALLYPLGPDGKIDRSQRDSQEPIAGDVRIKSGESPREAHQPDMKVHREVIDFMKLKLIAGLMGVGFDELAQRDKARAAVQARARVRRMAMLASAFAVLGVAAVVAAVIAFFSRNAAVVAQGKAVAAQKDAVAQQVIASQQRDLAVSREKEVRARLANLYEEKGRQALTGGDPASAAPYLVEAWKTYPERPELQLLVGMALQPLQGQRLILNGHAGAVRHVVWSPDGKYIASADDVGSVRLWDASQGTPVTSFQLDTPNGLGRNILSLLFTLGSDQLIATNDYGSIALLNLAQPTNPPLLLKHSNYAVYASLSKDGKLLATVGMGAMNTPAQEICIWQLPGGTNLATFGDGEGKSGCFSRDGKALLVASADGAVRVWDWSAKKITFDQKADGPMTKAVFIQDDKFIAGTGTQNLLTWWDSTSGVRTLDIKPSEMNGELTSLEVTPDGGFLFTAGLGDAQVTDLQTQPVKSLELKSTVINLLNTAHLSSDGKFVVFCPHVGRDTSILDATTGNKLAPLVGQQGDVYDAAFSPDGRQVAVAGRDHRVLVWDWTQVVNAPPLPTHDLPVLTARFGTTNRIITATGNALRIWNESESTLMKEITSPPDPSLGGIVGYIKSTLSPDGTHLATSGFDKMVHLYDGVTGEPGLVLSNESPGIALEFSPDGTLLGSGGQDGKVKIWDVATGQQKSLLPGTFHNLDQVRFDPTGTRLLVLDQKDAPTIWDIASNQQKAEMKADGISQEIGAFSPDGTRVFTGGSDHQVRAWNASTGQCEYTLGPFINRLSLIEFSPDGKILSLYAGGESIYFYDTDTGKLRCQWDNASRGSISSMKFWPNSHFLAATIFNSISFFDPDTSQLLAEYRGEGVLSNLHFTPDGTAALVSEEKTARVVPLFRALKDPVNAAEEVDRLDRWKLVDGRLVAK